MSGLQRQNGWDVYSLKFGPQGSEVALHVVGESSVLSLKALGNADLLN